MDIPCLIPYRSMINNTVTEKKGNTGIDFTHIIIVVTFVLIDNVIVKVMSASPCFHLNTLG